MANQQYDESKIDYTKITKKETEKFNDYKTISKFFKHQEDLIFGIGSSLNKVQKEKDIKRVWFQEKYDNNLQTYQKSHQLLEKRKYNNEDILKFVKDGQVWDIDEQEKLWIFSIFSVDDLVECFFDPASKLDMEKRLSYLKNVWCGETKDPLWTLYLNEKEQILNDRKKFPYEQIIKCEPSFTNVTFDDNISNILSWT